jgi:hypothetical protein
MTKLVKETLKETLNESENRYIDYIKDMKLDMEKNGVLDNEDYIDLLDGFRVKLENWLMEKPRFSDDKDFVEMTAAIRYISKEIELNK